MAFLATLILCRVIDGSVIPRRGPLARHMGCRQGRRTSLHNHPTLLLENYFKSPADSNYSRSSITIMLTCAVVEHEEKKNHITSRRKLFRASIFCSFIWSSA